MKGQIPGKRDLKKKRPQQIFLKKNVTQNTVQVFLTVVKLEDHSSDQSSSFKFIVVLINYESTIILPSFQGYVLTVTLRP